MTRRERRLAQALARAKLQLIKDVVRRAKKGTR